MQKLTRLAIAGTALALSTLVVQGALGADSRTRSPGAGEPDVLFSDDFGQWGTGTGDNDSVEYKDGALEFIIYKTNYFTWSTPNGKNYESVHVEVTALNNGTDSTTALGILCDQQSESDDYYYAAITPAGQYAIAKAEKGQADVFLTNHDRWAFSDQITKNANSYRIGMDCGANGLALYVDGNQVATVTDSSYTSGTTGLFVWSGEDAKTTDVSYDDYIISALP